jgi:hypothetical protein
MTIILSSYHACARDCGRSSDFVACHVNSEEVICGWILRTCTQVSQFAWHRTILLKLFVLLGCWHQYIRGSVSSLWVWHGLPLGLGDHILITALQGR